MIGSISAAPRALLCFAPCGNETEGGGNSSGTSCRKRKNPLIKWALTTDYDVLIIGGGPGGYAAAIRSAQYGLKVGVIEKAPKPGGTCLHVGCIPTKALLHFAEVYEDILRAEDFGIAAGPAHVDMAKMRDKKRQIVEKHAAGIEFLFKKHKITLIQGYGRLAGNGAVEARQNGGAKTLTAGAVILATGSEARMLPGLEVDPQRILTNVEILDQTEVPASLAIIGAGAVGVEFASIYRSFGAQVTLLEMLPRLVPMEDEEVSTELARAFRKRGIQVLTGAKVDGIEPSPDGVSLAYTDADGKQGALAAEKLLVAVGRKPNTENIGLENAAIPTERGFIAVDGFMETARKGVFAIGDIVAGAPQLAHTATAEGLVAAARIAGKEVEPIDYNLNPSCTYCEPQIASVGLTEARAREAGHAVKVSKFSFAGNAKASILGGRGGFVKVVADEKYGEILGVHIIGPQATESIHEAVVAMKAEGTVETMTAAIHAHPTLSEAVQEAFNGIYGLTING